MEKLQMLKNERALKKGNLTRTRRRAFVLIDSVGSKRELRSMLKELDTALQDVLEVNLKLRGELDNETELMKCQAYGEEATAEHALAVERLEAHLQERAGEPASVASSKVTAASKTALTQHAVRMAEVEDKVHQLELQQLQHRLHQEEQEQRLHRERLLQEKEDAIKAAKLKGELTRAAETDLAWERREDFCNEREPEAEGADKKEQVEKTKEFDTLLFRQSLPRLRLPTFGGQIEEWPRWYALFKTMVHQQDMSVEEKMVHLQNAVTGAARSTIGGMICDGSSYEEALQALQDRYGRELDVVQTTLRNVFSCPGPKPNDSKSLERYFGAVHGATTTLKKMGYEGDIQSIENLRRLVSKLPLELRKAWAEHSLNIGRATLIHFDEWLRNQVRILLTFEATAAAPVSCPKRTTVMFTTTAGTGGKRCCMCNGDHGLWSCDQFKSKTVDERAQAVAANRLCFSCLRPGHQSRNCRTARECGVDGCHLRHNRLLHGSRRVRGPAPSTRLAAGTVNATNEATIASIRHGTTVDSSSVLLQVVPVRVHGSCGRFKDTLALLDPGAQTSLCNVSLLDELQVDGEIQTLRLNNVEAAGQEKMSRRVQLELSPLAETEEGSQKIYVPEAFSVDRVNVRVPVLKKKALWKLKHLQGLKIPDLSGGEVQLLLGANVLEAVLQREARVGEPGEPVAIRTAFGWSLTGSLASVVPEHHREVMFVGRSPAEQSEEDLSTMLQNWWATESFGTKHTDEPVLTPDDEKALRILEKTTRHLGERYEVGLLWQDEEVSLPNNYTMACSRLRSLERSLMKSPEKAAAYSEVLESYIAQGYAKKLTPQEAERQEKKKLWILPHHAVMHPEKDKPRVVFDAAAVCDGTSLNSVLLRGPDFMQSLHGVLLRFRQEPFAVVGDIYQMFHQIKVRDEDRPALSFLWRGVEVTEPPSLYQMQVVIFGAKCSPSIANYIVRRTLTDSNGAEKLEEGKPSLISSFYVDDFLRSEETADAALSTMEQVKSLMRQGGFRLNKWRSNCPELLEHLPESDRDASQKKLTACEGGARKALGCLWSPTEDTLSIQVRTADVPATKRGVVRMAAMIFDPLGIITPFLLQAKIIIQKLWAQKLDWDEEFSGVELTLWQKWLAELSAVKDIKVPRSLKMSVTGNIKEMELHLFSDASEDAFAAVAYVRMTGADGRRCVSFVMSRSRVAPLKQLSIVRLELQGAVLATRLAKTIQKELTYKFEDVVFWTDSQVVLQFVANESRMFQTFVANRVSEIRDSTDPSQWRHVPGVQNPADISSRGLPASQLRSSALWWNGPEFLMRDRGEWPHLMTSSLPADQPELKRKPAGPAVSFVGKAAASRPLVDPTRFSSWSKYRRIVAWAHRFIWNVRTKEKRRGPLTVEELLQAEQVIIREDQEREKMAPQPGVTLFKDDKGIVRVEGRLKNAPAEICRQPIALSPGSEVTRLIVTDLHERCMHAGLNHTLNLVRKKFWMPKARASVKKLIWRCAFCRNRRAIPTNPKMADLPSERFDASRPFSSVGLDFLGPIVVRKFRKSEKRYILLVTCLATRAIHLEVANAMDTDSFLMALRRFIARRGRPTSIWSDNGTNLVGGERELRESIAAWNQEQICDTLSQQNIQWKFNPPTASHMGGSWERLVASVKRALQAVLGNQIVPDDVLHTTVVELEFQVNSRPLTYVSGDGGDPESITPNHFLLGAVPDGCILPPGVFGENDKMSRRRWKQSQALANDVWRRWLKEYLPTLIPRRKWEKNTRNLAVNDVVLMAADDAPRGHWPLGVVEQVYASEDGVVRSVLVRTATGKYRRPCTKVCLLEGQTM
ncbi:uncharacterized protein LOC122391871 [Amphibalanus amphitrite]|uniref:uncharacterized protein LOC122391871 n=1 Tax=Amphibalanus amphitrite TaxID=1232801 RepID=UPI001C92122A|nr:uncharacterized protein LOC122391871 [Amphibalanus amphitrite]XP_043242112.1 uncharacterized protein LOC122391871 [Amphibalanus amphitrite]